ncbi:MAG: hypothetical protein FWH27_04195 [Planctomycetaceae bacterium]|nr:hypothetical protein [Planctomycetaceae bacterium]
MKLRDYFEHFGIEGNPFSEEDAQKDQVFQDHCIETTFHPAWDKLYGKPAEPDTAIIFGEKGSGKTALRYQMINAVKKYNNEHPELHPIVIEYANWNPFLDHFRRRFSDKKRIENVLSHWQLWDHIDAILSLGVTQVVDQLLIPGEVFYPAATPKKQLDPTRLSRHKKRDLLALATFYDQPKGDAPVVRWKQLAKKTGFSNWKSFFRLNWDAFFGVILTFVFFFILSRLGYGVTVLANWWFYGLILLFWLPRLLKVAGRYNRAFWVTRRLRVLNLGVSSVFRRLMHFQPIDYAGISFPARRGTDTRYELLSRFLDVLDALGYRGMIVLVDQVDEPYLISGSPELMQKVLWPMFDNKLLKYPGVGFKFLLPSELLSFLERETVDFHQRARIDKQNLIRSLDWTGKSLYDLANDRLRSCQASGSGFRSEPQPGSPKSDARSLIIDDLFDPSITRTRLESSFEQLRVPRHLFKFLYRVIMAHVNAHSDGEPVWQISPARFETEMALYLNDRRASERNVGVI